jgi:hypothetical protein
VRDKCLEFLEFGASVGGDVEFVTVVLTLILKSAARHRQR